MKLKIFKRMSKKINSRREFIKKNSFAGLAAALSLGATSSIFAENSTNEDPKQATFTSHEPIIDIHQHLNFHGRSDAHFLAHQRAMGITTTILLPAGRPAILASTHGGDSNGLAVEASGNEECYIYAQKHPEEFFFGANDVPDLPDALGEIEKYLKLGAKVIGELKFAVEIDSPEMQKIYQLAQEYDVPILMHWQYEKYNHGFEQFHKMLEKFPKVNFIGHAQAWWANIDKDPKRDTSYPEGELSPGGLTDQLLSDYPNIFGDLASRSGLNALLRDEDYTREFFRRHQDKLLFGSDCADPYGWGPGCRGAEAIETIRRLSPNKKIERKLLFENAKRLFRL